jgi:hypothetical protein
MAGNEVGPWPHANADGAEHPARLNGLVVGDTARSRKSTAFNQVRRLLRTADPDFIATRVRGGFGSGEALIDDIAQSEDKRLWLVEHEFARVLVVAQRDGSILSIIMRQAWDGDRLEARTRKTIVVADDAFMSVIGHITLEDLRTNLKSADAANGFLNRFLVILVRRSKLLPSGQNSDDQELRGLAREINLALTKARTITEISRSEKAEVMWEKRYNEMAEDNPRGLLGALVARSEAQVLRLSVAYALTDGSAVIKTHHLRAAWALWSYARASAAYVFGRGYVADTVLTALVKQGRAGLSRTDISDLLGHHSTKQEIDAALQALEREDLIESFTTSRSTGRPQTRVRLKRVRASAVA